MWACEIVSPKPGEQLAAPGPLLLSVPPSPGFQPRTRIQTWAAHTDLDANLGQDPDLGLWETVAL
jgi:hypothetical protein